MEIIITTSLERQIVSLFQAFILSTLIKCFSNHKCKQHKKILQKKNPKSLASRLEAPLIVTSLPFTPKLAPFSSIQK